MKRLCISYVTNAQPFHFILKKFSKIVDFYAGVIK